MATVAFIMVCGPMLTVNVDSRTLKLGMKHPWTQSLRFKKNKLGGSCGDHVGAIKGPKFSILRKEGAARQAP